MFGLTSAPSLDLEGKRILLVGASSGIGRALALGLAARGAHLCLFARRKDLLDQLGGEILAQGREAEIFGGDSTEAASVSEAFAHFTRHRPLDGFLYLAGISHVTQPREITQAEAREILEVNFFGFLAWLELILPVMIARGEGFVGGCSALCAHRGIPTGEAYSASKSALNAYLESLRLDLKPYGVQVFQLMPGFVKSPMSDLNNFTQPFMISAEKATEIILEGLESGRFRIEFGVGMSRLMRLLRVLPDRFYERLFAGFSRSRHDAEAMLLELPPFLCPTQGVPLHFDRYGAFRSPESESWVRFQPDRLDILESSEQVLDGAHEKMTATYRIYSVTYPVTAFLAMTLVWNGRLGPLVDFYAEALEAAEEDGAPLLDVATGDAALLSLALKKARVTPSIFSVDLSPDMVAKAARRLRSYRRKLFYIHDIGTLNMPDRSFRHLACYGGFHVFPEPEIALSKMARLLAPGGILSGSILTRPEHSWGSWWSDRFIRWGALSNSRTEEEIDGNFREAGLEFVEKQWNGHMLLFRARTRASGPRS